MKKLILTSNQCPGDIVMMTAAVRDLHAAHPGKYLTDVRTPHPDIWRNNPHITPIPDGEGRVIETIGKYHPKENPSFIEVDADRAAVPWDDTQAMLFLERARARREIVAG